MSLGHVIHWWFVLCERQRSVLSVECRCEINTQSLPYRWTNLIELRCTALTVNPKGKPVHYSFMRIEFSKGAAAMPTREWILSIACLRTRCAQCNLKFNLEMAIERWWSHVGTVWIQFCMARYRWDDSRWGLIESILLCSQVIWNRFECLRILQIAPYIVYGKHDNHPCRN